MYAGEIIFDFASFLFTLTASVLASVRIRFFLRPRFGYTHTTWNHATYPCAFFPPRCFAYRICIGFVEYRTCKSWSESLWSKNLWWIVWTKIIPIFIYIVFFNHFCIIHCLLHMVSFSRIVERKRLSISSISLFLEGIWNLQLDEYIWRHVKF